MKSNLPPLRHYVDYSSIFPAIPYEIAPMRARLRLRGLIQLPRACRLNGWNNQPQVLTFQLTRKGTVEKVAQALSEMKCFNGKLPIIKEKTW